LGYTLHGCSPEWEDRQAYGIPTKMCLSPGYDLAQVGHPEFGVANGRGIDVDADFRSLPGKQVFLETRWYVNNKYIFTLSRT